MKCEHCGAELREGVAFCPQCGAPVEPPTASGDAPRHVDSEATRFVSYAGDDATRIAHLSGGEETQVAHLASDDLTQMARRREETVVPGETTLLPHEGEGAGESAGFEIPDDRGLGLDGLDVPVDPPVYAAPAPQEPFTPEPKRHRTMTYVFIGIAAVVVAAVLGAFITWRLELWGGVSVPDVMGLTEAEATSTLTEAGFQVGVSPVVVDAGAGTVVSMQPQAGRRVALGRTIELGVGVERSVPEIVGLSLDEAREKLTASAIEHVRLEYQNSPEPKGSVIAVSPVAGTKVGADDVVTVVVAQPYTVPDVRGLTESAALASLERAGLEGSVSYVPSDEVEAGRVVSSDPVAGTELSEGHTVALSVSSPYPKDAFDIDGLLSFKPEDVSSFLLDSRFSVTYAKVSGDELSMAWEPDGPTATPEADGIEVAAIGFSPLPFAVPHGFQLFPRNYLQEGVAPQGACVALVNADGGTALALTQDCVTEIMNLCGLRSESGATTTAAGIPEDPEGTPNYVAKASVMGEDAWYVVVWETAQNPLVSTPLTGSVSAEPTLVAMAGIAPKNDLDRALESAGIHVGDYDSMADLAATLVINGD